MAARLPQAGRFGLRSVLRRVSGLSVFVWLAVGWLVVIGFAALLAPWLPLENPVSLNLPTPSAPPSLHHLLGTDDITRDMLSRVIWGARISLSVGIGAVAASLTVGGALGILAGYYRGVVDGVVVGVSEVMLSFPVFILAIAITGFAGHGTVQVTFAIAVALAPTFVRVARGSTLSVLQRDYVLAARSIGASPRRLLWQEVLPNVLPTLITLATTLTGVAIVAEGSLSFLGVGIRPPTPSWGSMIAEGRDSLVNAPHVSLEPAGIMFLTVLSLAVLGDRFQGRYFGTGAAN